MNLAGRLPPSGYRAKLFSAKCFLKTGIKINPIEEVIKVYHIYCGLSIPFSAFFRKNSYNGFFERIQRKKSAVLQKNTCTFL
jgi:hypothetical protein